MPLFNMCYLLVFFVNRRGNIWHGRNAAGFSFSMERSTHCKVDMTRQRTDLTNPSCLDLALEGERLCKTGDCSRGVVFFEAAMAIGTDNLEVLSALYSQLGNAYFYLGKYSSALEYHRHDQNLTRTLGDRQGLAKASGNLGNTLKALGKFEEAKTCFQHHLDIAVEMCDKVSQSRALYNMASLHQTQGKKMIRESGRERNNKGSLPPATLKCIEAAVKYYKESIEISRELGDKATLGRAYGNLGNTYHLLENYSNAVHYHKLRLESAKEFGDEAAARRAYSNLGTAYIFLKKLDDAKHCFLQSLQISVKLGERALEGQACYSLGNVFAMMGNYESALQYHTPHLIIAQALGDRVGESRVYGSLSYVHMMLGDTQQAHTFASKSEKLSTEIGDAQGVQYARNILAQLAQLSPRTLRKKGEEQILNDDATDGKAIRTSMEKLQVLPQSGNQCVLSRDPPCATESNTHTATQGSEESQFFELLSRYQSRRMDDQRYQLQESLRADSQDVPERVPDNLDFFDRLSRFQSNRMDDQRCDFQNMALPIDINNASGELSLSALQEQLVNIVMRSQSSEIADQRADLSLLCRPFPGLRRHLPVSLSTPEDLSIHSNSDESFFDMLMRMQSTRLNDQRSNLTPSHLSVNSLQSNSVECGPLGRDD